MPARRVTNSSTCANMLTSSQTGSARDHRIGERAKATLNSRVFRNFGEQQVTQMRRPHTNAYQWMPSGYGNKRHIMSLVAVTFAEPTKALARQLACSYCLCPQPAVIES